MIKNNDVSAVRPGLAKIGFFICILYLMISECARVFFALPGPDIQVASLLMSPAGFWFTLRTADGFSKKGKTTTDPGET